MAIVGNCSCISDIPAIHGHKAKTPAVAGVFLERGQMRVSA
jgi:hypothetical protein